MIWRKAWREEPGWYFYEDADGKQWSICRETAASSPIYRRGWHVYCGDTLLPTVHHTLMGAEIEIGWRVAT